MDNQKIKKYWNKFWFIVWKDQSLKGWIISIVFIFILIKLIFFPLLNLATGTALPLAIVESCSMHHKGNLFSNHENWWENHESKYSELQITKEQFNNFNLKKGFTKGDIVFITRAKPQKLEIGDVIVFDAGRNNPIIHRITKIETNQEGEKTFSTMGDNNNGQLEIEKSIQENQLIGKARFRIMPFIGWIKLSFYESKRTPQEKGFCDER